MLKSLECIIQCLERTISPDKKILAEAQLMLEKCVQENVGQFISNMSIILADQKNSSVARQAAGLQLKNCLTIRDESLKEEYQQRWSNLPEKIRNTVRNRLISSLGTENIYPSCAAQCLAYIGAAELLLPKKPSSSEMTSLKDLLSELSGIVSKPASEHHREAALESIAYLCQEIRPEVLFNFYTSILDPILICMKDGKSTDRIRVAAARALLSSLECIHPSFETEKGRDTIMQVVCNGTQSSVAEESVIWLEILVKIGSIYYPHLQNYMDSAILPITLNAIRSPDSNISLQGIEFWSSIAEIEFNLASCSYDPTLVIPSSFYAEQALPVLVPQLMYVLTTRQDGPNDIEDLEDWTPFRGACSCLMFLAQCCPNTIDIYVTPQVRHLIELSNNWRQCNAALWAILSILEELNPKRAYTEILPFMASFWELTNYRKSAKVRYSAHILMRKIFEVSPYLIPATLSPLIKGLLERLDDDDHRVIVVACQSLSSLVKVVYKLTSKQKQYDALPSTASLSRYYKRIIEKLLEYTATPLENLKAAAHHTLGDVLLRSPNDCYRFVKSTIETLIGMLRDEMTDSENESYFSCITLSKVIKKLKADEIQIRHELMSGLVSILQSGVINENVFLVTSKTISLLPLNELKVHLPALITYFKSAIELPDACPVIGLIGDLFRALGTESLPYLDFFSQAVFDLLTQKEVATKLRSECIAALMDMAISVGMQHFQPYIDRTLNQLHYASSITVKKDPEHEELQEFMLQLYGNLFIYISDQVSLDKSSKNQNQKFTSKLNLMEKCLAGLSELIVAVVDEDTSDVILLASAKLVGIIFEKLGAARAMKYLEFNLNWLLNTAVYRTCESNDGCVDSDHKFVLSTLQVFNASSVK